MNFNHLIYRIQFLLKVNIVRYFLLKYYSVYLITPYILRTVVS
jgi:hypothetical protein